MLASRKRECKWEAERRNSAAGPAATPESREKPRCRPPLLQRLIRPLLYLKYPFPSWCSSATTLIMNRFKFGSQKLSKRPDVIRQSGGHARGSVAPLGLNQARGVWLLRRQRQA